MGRKRFTAEQIIRKLREAEVLTAKGQAVHEVCRHLGVTDQTYYRWRRESLSKASSGQERGYRGRPCRTVDRRPPAHLAFLPATQRPRSDHRLHALTGMCASPISPCRI